MLAPKLTAAARTQSRRKSLVECTYTKAESCTTVWF